MHNALLLKNVSSGYRGHLVDDGVSFSVAFGTAVCLLGANGCGKTTLLKTILGLLPLQSGEIELNGKALALWTRPTLAQFIAYVPQATQAVFPFTAEEVVLMGRASRLKWFETPGKRDRAIALHAMATLGIEALAKRPFTKLSGGERQLVLIARALCQEAKVLLLDEPTASLDFGNQLRVLEGLKNLRNEGVTILMTTHQPRHAERLADKILLMKHGKLCGEGSPEEKLTPRTLSEVYDIELNYLQDEIQ
jgi:iron complex transport system ATP-binding protein